jgi:hypothetical protein
MYKISQVGMWYLIIYINVTLLSISVVHVLCVSVFVCPICHSITSKPAMSNENRILYTSLPKSRQLPLLLVVRLPKTL